jgi:hypothetical protein
MMQGQSLYINQADNNKKGTLNVITFKKIII